MARDLDIPPHSYGPLIETTARIVTWNVWGLYGPWREREAAIATTLAGAAPDIVVLAESWAKAGEGQCARLAGPLKMPHHAFSGVKAQEDESALSGVGVMSRWPISTTSISTFGALRVQYAEIDGPRGPIQMYGVVMDAWWLDESRARQEAVRGLLAHVHAAQDDRIPLVLCGDFNADPDSDEIRMMTGRAAAPAPGLSFYDAWEVAGDGTRGCTWSNENAWATQLLWPERRIDYVFTAAPRRGGAGHPLRAAILGTSPVHGLYPSDHYAVQADIRY
ncbi:endonuclease/exonuclease/phosphatase family protein [Arthrobacter sp. ISL-48]|uniref:endonuclease/exonuclease/phosphatase family protein n=1 Tax=Arthrobacter sp. ISL-48 TaxID=2819110 RepID=UPI001BEA40F0|nr:endonuclease/exonuclease/phosphatase family protein [Arthrobacter sp. ISL-48]MBT2532964.1 endonuclease/exonuclease/phosphatase family protein [Arthrobacter sp. ISL-48]